MSGVVSKLYHFCSSSSMPYLTSHSSALLSAVMACVLGCTCPYTTGMCSGLQACASQESSVWPQANDVAALGDKIIQKDVPERFVQAPTFVHAPTRAQTPVKAALNLINYDDSWAWSMHASLGHRKQNAYCDILMPMKPHWKIALCYNSAKYNALKCWKMSCSVVPFNGPRLKVR
eukprot:scaffold40316_cov22-Tisochrysis_lutea.AAC.1